MSKDRVAVYVDGSNLYFKLRSLGVKNLTKFDYRGLVEWLARGRIICGARYYVGVVRASPDNEKGQVMRQEQQRLFAHLQSAPQRFKVRRGYLMENQGAYHEKGVDVQMAVDMLVGAYEDHYDVAVVISSDTDLIPVIEKARAIGKKIEYIGFAHQPSFGLQKRATLSRLLIRQEVATFEVSGQ